MHTALLTTARLAITAWVGGAVLFVITGVREVTTTDRNLNQSIVKDALTAVRFPGYYVFGGVLVVVTLLCVAMLPHKRLLWKLRRWLILGVLTAALLLMIADYFWIYQPLLGMITPPGKRRVAEFVDYHKASMWVNAADVGLCFVASVLLCLPVKRLEA